ncbi:MAG: flagella basal body P-ring formation protein FlgA [Sphingomonadaceae bacterium]
MRFFPVFLPLAFFSASLISGSPAAPEGLPEQSSLPMQIDAEVARFTGHAAGHPGGAITRTDPRIRLAPCQQPLALEWYGRSKNNVLVRCPTAGSWRIFVPLVPVSAKEAASGDSSPVMVARGETVTLIAKGNGFSLTRQAEALQSGTAGDWISIRPLGTGRKARETMRARILSPGTVSITTH